MNDEERRVWRIGELAQASGLSVRALRHYDELGLLVPAERTGSGYRMYSAAGVDPGDPSLDPSLDHVRAHARELVGLFTGGEPDMAASLGRMWSSEDPADLSRGGIDPEVVAYARQVFGAGDGLR
jgi:hypothetical protein